MVHRAMLRRTYNWCIAAADKPYALWILAAVAFAESSFFPVPPDIMLLPMALARPQRAWLFASLCTIASVAGGVLGRVLGGGATPTITPDQASQISPADAGAIAAHAEKTDPSVMDRAGEFYAQHPQLVKGLGAAALAIALGRMHSGQR